MNLNFDLVLMCQELKAHHFPSTHPPTPPFLQRYEEAAQAFREVLKLDSSCSEAAHELMRVQTTQLMVRNRIVICRIVSIEKMALEPISH